MFRIGEASVPGPTHPECIIGCINPTGVLGKTTMLASLPKDGHAIWAVSETHLSRPGMTKFHQQLKLQKTGLQAQLGSPVPVRSHTPSAIAGKHRGVGFLCSTPHRGMTASWPKAAWEESRFHVACFQCGKRWIQGGVVYGYASHPQMTITKQKTDQQCQFVVDRLVDKSQGLRFIGGDFNQPDGALPSMEKLADAGWINVQSWAFQKLGKPIQATCKLKTTIDHLYVSPQLAMYLRDVEVQQDWFADHAVLIARFRPLGEPPMLPMWRKPSPIDWTMVPQEMCDQFFQQPAEEHDSTKYYAELWTSVEQAADQTMQAKHKCHLSQTAKGRGHTLEVRWVQEYTAPTKKGRQGEHEPSFHGINLQHSRWTRQYRRLINYTRLAKQTQPSESAAKHRDQLWKSIIEAPGFQPSFPNRLAEQKPTLGDWPLDPPDFIKACEVCQSFHEILTRWEKQLTQHRCQTAKQTRLDDPMVIFKDLRGDPPQPVQMLVDNFQTVVTEVDPEECALITQHDVPWNPDQAVRGTDIRANIIHADEHKLWLDSVEGFAPGMPIEQDSYIGNLNELFSKFNDEWSSRWDRHQAVDDTQWDPIVQFAHLALPQPEPMEYRPISYEEWMNALKAKSKRSATGPDGVSRKDLMHLPRQATECLLRLFADIEEGREWPRQLTLGIVAALEKVPGAATTNKFRPITILPIAYRVWGSIRAKQILRHLQPLVPETCAGNVPGRQAADIWYHILTAIELAQYSQTSMTGGVLDLEKAFNMLPRMPILEFLKILQVHPKILGAWSKLLISLERRFTIRQCVGPPLKSSSGFAEGCPLSVTAMLAANLVVHQYLQRRYPEVMLWTFVDNWEVTSNTAAQVEAAIEALQAFCSIMDMRIDAGKTYTWSVEASQRKALRDSDHQVRLGAKDLGGHIQYSQVVSNATIVTRCHDIQPLWGKLARSLAPYRQKVHALRAKAWPACLHGIASVHLGEEHYQRLRTGAVQGLGEHSPGTSPLIHLSLIEAAQTDPQFSALYTTVTMFRMMYPHLDLAHYCFQELHLPKKVKVPRPGTISVLLERLHQIGWSWETNEIFRDQWGQKISLATCPIQELKARLILGWQQRIQGQVSERKTMEGIQWMSPILTVPTLQHLDPESQALLRVALNGTFFTADRQKYHATKKGDPDADKCVFCGQLDSQLHRQWDCSHFDSIRPLTRDQIETLKGLPPCITNHGWMPEPPVMHKYQSALLAIPDEHADFVWPAVVPPHLECFTDGSCLSPTSPVGRLASWGVVLGDPDMQQFHPLACGLVPGWLQTTLRGELWATISAMTFAVQTARSVRIWCDNQMVVNRLCKANQHSRLVACNRANADLWNQAYQLARQLGDRLEIIKISSHQDPAAAKDEGEAWLFAGNAAADRLAEHAFSMHPQVHRLWEQLKNDIEAIHIMRNKVHAT